MFLRLLSVNSEAVWPGNPAWGQDGESNDRARRARGGSGAGAVTWPGRAARAAGLTERPGDAGLEIDPRIAGALADGGKLHLGQVVQELAEREGCFTVDATADAESEI